MEKHRINRIGVKTIKDIYGQNIKVCCTCGLKTGLHTSKEYAIIALRQLHEDKYKGKTTKEIRRFITG